MESAERTITTLHELKEIGVKVDQSFVHNLTAETNDAAITRAVIHLGHSLKLKVIAEGVETEAQLAFLRRHRCEEAQGYLFGAPVPPDTLATSLRGHSGRRAFRA